MEQLLFIIIYVTIIIQLCIGIVNNKTHTIFGKYSSEIINQKINVDNNILVNYYKSLHWKKITHIIQGCLIGLILLNDNIFNIDKYAVVCNSNIINIINIPLFIIIIITLWQLKIIPLYIPILVLVLLINKVNMLCSTEQLNIIKILLTCGYIIYNLGKRSFYPQFFIESSYFSNLFDIFIGITLSLFIYLNSNITNKIFNTFTGINIFIIILFIIHTFIVIKLVNYSKNILDNKNYKISNKIIT